MQVKDAPTTAVAGGAPVEFDVTVTNPSASRYTTVDKVVEADKHSTLQVRKADGSWENITGTPSSQPGSDRVTYHLTDDRTIAAGSSDTRHVRFAFTADAPLGTAYIHPWAMLDQGPGAMQAIVGPPVLTAATLGVLLATGAVLSSPAAYAAQAPTAATAPAAPAAQATADKPALKVNAPATVGRGGQPVEFTETITNPGTTEASFTLKIGTSGTNSVSAYAIKVDYRDADGTWAGATGADSRHGNTPQGVLPSAFQPPAGACG